MSERRLQRLSEIIERYKDEFLVRSYIDSMDNILMQVNISSIEIMQRL
jgi:RNase P subunit RPR2